MQYVVFGLFISFTFLIEIVPLNSFNLDAKYFKEIKEKPNQYFGYSIEFRKYLNQYKILVGAPKANDPTLEPASGALYECNIESPYNCRMVELSLTPELNSSSENQWLGVSLDVSPKDSRVTVCAHRYRVHFSYSDSIPGTCYEMVNLNSPVQIQKYGVDNFNALFGMSCRYSKMGELIVGVPGYNTPSRGGYFLNPNFVENKRPDYNSGYTVTFLDRIPVIGKPKYQQYGAVAVENELIYAPQTKYTFGSYFGSAIATADLNEDGYKDLVIGAPFYSETLTEEGRVYIYFYDTLEHMFVENPNYVLKEPSYRAQFGKSLVTGDINSDKYQDVIVGAPYENEGTGCIYVYNGIYKGLETEYSQKINGESLQTGLKTFGISFTRTVDLDQNGYADVGVGAYLSDSVFIFKARPTYVVRAYLGTSEQSLDMKPKCLLKDRLVLCINLTVTLFVSTSSVMKYNLHIITDSSKSSEEKRTYFDGGANEIEQSVIVNPPKFEKVYQVFIKNTMDIMSPIKFTLHYSLEDYGYSPSCQPLCPISKNNTITKTIKFNLDCGSDKICQTNLKVQLESFPPNITLGRDKKLMAAIKVFNLGEHAYNARARIFFSPFLDFESVSKPPNSSVECTAIEKMELFCFLGNPLKENTTKLFVLNFSLGQTTNVTKAFVAMNASTDSQVEPRFLNNTVNLTITFYRESDLELAVTSVPDTLPYAGKDGPMTAKHIYQLRNNGPSNAFGLIFSVNIPYFVINNSPLMTIKKYQMRDGNRNIFISNDSICHLNKLVGSNADFKTDLKSIFKHRNNANCSWLKCHRIDCSLSKLEINNVKLFEITFNIDTRILKTFQNKLRAFEVVSNATLKLVKSQQVIKDQQTQSNVSTSFLISRLRKEIQWWIVVCSIIIGLIFLIILGVVLWKLGFFRRNRVSVEDRQSLAVPAENSAPSQPESTENT